MDPSETIAKVFLLQQGFSDKDIKYEPDGNIPPDFLINKHIAVEVRRLNHSVSTDTGFKGLEEDRIPLFHRMLKLLKSLGPDKYHNTWFVSYSFRRTLPEWPLLESKIRNELINFSTETPEVRAEIHINKNFTLFLDQAEHCHDYRFILGGYGDHDAGGWVLPELAKNLNICIDKKWKKIAPMHEKYNEWWLLLLDQINYGSPDVLEDGLIELGIKRVGWDRIIHINPTDPLRFCEI